MANSRPTALRTDQVATRLNLSERTIRRMIRDGQLRGFRVGQRHWRVWEHDLVKYLARRQPADAPAHGG